ncbi:MAG: hypothetical protein ACI8TS_001556 [Flavobacteriales bacterium]|jgi:hypothetical protein
MRVAFFYASNSYKAILNMDKLHAVFSTETGGE